MVEKDERYINIADKKNVIVTKEDWENIKENPEGLTIEGVKFNIKQWGKGRTNTSSKAGNRYVVAKYNKMLRECKEFTKSGKLENGGTVLSRDKEGNVTWTQMVDENFDLISESILVKEGI